MNEETFLLCATYAHPIQPEWGECFCGEKSRMDALLSRVRRNPAAFMARLKTCVTLEARHWAHSSKYRALESLDSAAAAIIVADTDSSRLNYLHNISGCDGDQ